MRYLKYVLGLFLVAVLTACGGGGGSPGATSGTVGRTPTATVGTPTLTIELRNAANVSTNAISGATSARATLRDSNGAVVAGRLVTFTADSTLVKFTPASGQALSDASGVATVQVSPASISASGAGTLNVAAIIDNDQRSTSFDYQLSASNVALTSLNLGSGGLPSFGNRAISVIATIDGVPATNTPIQVTFAATCGTINPLTITTDATGRAATTYTANSAACSGSNVTISASAPGASPLSGIIAVQAPLATNIQFVSAAPQLIFLTGSVGATQSQLIFRVVDSGGNPLQNQSVQLSLVNTGPGVSLNTVGNTAPVTLTSDAAGQVVLAVFSGTVPTSVQVRAVLAANASVSATSNVLTVASGRPVQRAASLAVSKFAIEGFNIDGTLSDLTMSLADRQGNPVPDGTQVNFVAEAGVMIPAVCVVSGGSSSCKVSIRSQGTRPANGVVAVLAYVPGEEDFVDANFNNVYDAGETYTDLGNAYRDDNDSGAYDAGEFTVPRAGATGCAGGTNGRANTCDGAWGTVDVRAQANVVFATSVADLTNGTLTNVVVGTSTLGTLTLRIADLNGNSVSTGSSISVSVVSANNSGCAATLQTTVVPNSLSPVTIRAATAKCINGDRITVSVTAPSGLITAREFTVP